MKCLRENLRSMDSLSLFLVKRKSLYSKQSALTEWLGLLNLIELFGMILLRYDSASPVRPLSSCSSDSTRSLRTNSVLLLFRGS